MKKCSSCNQIYNDSENFCQNDGTALTLISAPQNLYSSADIPTVVLSNHPTSRQSTDIPVKQTSPILYAALGGMTVLVLVLAGFLLFPQKQAESETSKKVEESTGKKVEESNKSSADKDELNKSSVVIQTQPIIVETPEKRPSTPIPSPQQPYISPAGNWQGQWTNGKGSSFGQQLTLRDDGNGRLTGQVIHTLQSTVNPQKTGKIGLTAVEFVQGSYNPDTRIISLAGVRKDDPNDLIILDKYRLSISGDNTTLAGSTFGGRSRGRISLRR